MGLSPDAFYDLTPRQYNNMCTGFEDRLRAQEELEWQRTRRLGFWLLKTVKLKRPLNKESDLMELPSERKKNKKEPTKPMTNEEALALAAKWSKK